MAFSPASFFFFFFSQQNKLSKLTKVCEITASYLFISDPNRFPPLQYQNKTTLKIKECIKSTLTREYFIDEALNLQF